MTSLGDDDLRLRAEVWLRADERRRRSWSAGGTQSADDPVNEAGMEGSLVALEHVGALTTEEGAAWRRRLREAASWQEPVFDRPGREVRAAATRHLMGLLASLSGPEDPGSSVCFSAVWAYQHTGVLDAAQALAWREGILRRLGLEPERPPQCSRRELLRVLAGPPMRSDGLRITSVELYGDGVVLRWHHALPWQGELEQPLLCNDLDIEVAGGIDDTLLPRLTDALGTRYVGDSGPDLGIKSPREVYLGTSSFTPAVPESAQHLIVPLHAGDLTIEL